MNPSEPSCMAEICSGICSGC